MEVRKPHIKSIPYQEFKDNENLEKITKELNEGGRSLLVRRAAELSLWLWVVRATISRASVLR